MHGKWRAAAALLALATLLAGCITIPEADLDPDVVDDAQFEPHVIVAVPDTGINPYHELYYRPERVEHPCTYIRDFPCDIEALDLTLGGTDWDAAFEADKATWEAVVPGKWYWIPQTVFVAVSCDDNTNHPANLCILDDNHMHGTGTTASVIMENPDALIAFKEGGSGHQAFFDAGIPVDIVSVSWGYIVPMPVPNPIATKRTITPIYVLAAGNDPRSTLADHWAGDPYNIVVGGAYAEGRSEEAMAAKQPDVVSYYCRPTAQTKSVTEMRESYCGTSFAAPTVAGALSKVILALRVESGYTGSIEDGVVDPVLGLHVHDLREALNLTATYDPTPRYPNAGTAAVPLNPVAPWLQWGWGFYDGDVANATIAHLIGVSAASAKPEGARTYMATVQAAKEILHG